MGSTAFIVADQTADKLFFFLNIEDICAMNSNPSLGASFAMWVLPIKLF